MEFLYCLLVILLVLTALLFLAGFLIHQQLVMRRTLPVPKFLEKMIQGNAVPDTFAQDSAQALKRFDALPVQELSLKAPDGALLKARLLSPVMNNGKLIIACHGARSSGRGEFCFFAPDFYKKGYTLLMPDHRGCGESEGSFMGYGTHESTDTFLWVDYAREHFPDFELFLLGVSMGGATVLMMSNQEKIRDVQGVIADCSYTGIWEEFAYQLGASFHLPEFPLLPLCEFFNRIRCHYSLKQASPLTCVRRAKVPILFIHGAKDDFVPVYMQNQLYEACPAPKYKLTVPGAVHARSYYTDPEKYARAVEAFIRQTEKGSSAYWLE